jgi:CRP-like cAMP-binding protein
MNRFLAALKPTDRDALQSQMQVARFEAATVLHRPGEHLEHAFFPIAAVVSHSAAQDHGSPVETGTVGREGVVCAAALVGDGTAFECAMVQVPGDIAVIPIAAVQELFSRSPDGRRLLGAYLQAYTAQIAQSVLCNVSHPSEARLARWLLTCLDRIEPDAPLPLTNGLIAEMLGIGRPAATVVTSMLQTAGLIRATADGIAVLDRDGLEEASCDCYGRVRRVFERLLPTSYS